LCGFKINFNFNFNFNFKVVGVGPHRLGGRLIAAAPQDPRALSLRAIAGTTDMF
jgi:hypothetical protein